MSPLPDRRILESMRRADLQKLCKDRGLKANMKTEALIDLLIETSKPEGSGATHKRSSSMRIVSRPPSSSAARNRVGSMVIHDTDEEGEPIGGAEGEQMDTDPVAPNAASSQPSQIPMPAAGSRRAGDDQRRIGLGRPRALGGTGIRAPPRTASTSQVKRVKAGKSVRPVELPIQEEEEEQTPQAGPSGTSHDPPTTRSSSLSELSSQTPADPNGKSPQSSNDVVASLRAQLEETQAEVRRLASRVAEVASTHTGMDELRSEIATLRSESVQKADLEAQVRILREELASLRVSRSAESSHTRLASVPSSWNDIASHDMPAATMHATSSEEFLTHSSLGKRHRVSEDVDMTGVIEAGEAPELSPESLETQVLRPTRKKAKLAERESSSERASRPVYEVDAKEEEDDEVMPMAQIVQRGPGFTVFSGPEEPPEPLLDAPPSARLSDLFPATTPPAGATPSLPTNSAQGAENQLPHTGNNAFTFSYANSIFQPVTSTPLANLSVPAPEPPTSPSPAYVERAGGRRERNDPFYPTGRPHSRTSRPGSRNAHASSSTSTNAQRMGEATASPAAFLRAPPLPTVAEETRSRTPGQTATSSSASSSAGGAPAPTSGLLHRTGSLMIPGLIPLPVAPDTPAPPMKRTLYGTELEHDTRFGDFGVEGVATMGFGWGAAPRY